MRHARFLLYLMMAVLISLGSFYAGCELEKRNSEFSRYDALLFSLSNNMLFHDAIDANRPYEIKPNLIALIELEFAALVDLHDKNKFSEFEHLRCIVSKRIRALRDMGIILHDSLSLDEYPLEEVSEYLEKECRGQLQEVNWMDI